MFSSKKIRLFWWNEIKIQGKTKENYGDLLGKYLVEKISDRKVVFGWPKKFSFYDFFAPIYVTVGSILANVNNKCIVWGSGIVSKDYPIKEAKFLAVRGPQTRVFLLNLGYEVPEIYGDPALLLPKYYHPKISKEYKIGIIPHYNDFKKVKDFYENEDSILLIDLMTNNVEKTTNDILKCEKIVSSSLHGIIVAHAYGIPAIWQKFSDDVFGDDIKYQDYFESVQIPSYKSDIKNSKMSLNDLQCLFDGKETLPKPEVIEGICSNLMAVCPFKSEK
ncbi:polysaccharide pyruvyl transferase family protein [Sabulilitoribacter multivorans]|uniref:Polysaccharide pyruvyl transferase family protein n=1 Tax=Flaviramulus multivorans TaxID=1304750 RepID=A0ABS9IIC0_9FLAO|nr:polysaccharide pyruvyl transferase family protein [Flaviramulus multivorans]MCF7560313.1 polysaccharide pyruvyl transferase family protein [Flaviramulus multivorans]